MPLIFRHAFFLGLPILFSGCVSLMGTGFEPRAEGGANGYAIKKIGDGVFASSYIGNQYTTGTEAIAYTVIAAHAFCDAEGKLAVVAQPSDLSVTEKDIAVGLTTVPVYNSNGTTSYVTQNYTYPVSRKYPAYVSAFACQKRYFQFEAKLETEDIGRELVHATAKDFKGGVLVKSENAPPFKLNDVILKVNGVRVERFQAASAVLGDLPSGAQTVSLSVIRAEKVITLTVSVKEVTSNVVAVRKDSLEFLCGKLPEDTGNPRHPKYPPLCHQIKK